MNKLRQTLAILSADIRLIGDSNRTVERLKDQRIAVACKMTFGVDLLAQFIKKNPKVTAFEVERVEEVGRIETREEYFDALPGLNFIATMPPELVICEQAGIRF